MDNLFNKRNLSRSLQTLFTFAEHVSEGIAFMDFNGTICYANAAWAKMHGYAAPDELIEKNICLFHTPAQIKTGILPLMEEAKQKGGIEATLDHVRSDRSVFETLTKIIALNNTEGKNLGFTIFVTDLTEQRYFERSISELKLANELLQKQIANACQTKRPLVQQIDEMKNKNVELQNEISDHSPAQKQHEEAIPIREIPPFDPKKLKALADLAKRLAKKTEIPAAPSPNSV